jgi:hypothetical protein
MLKKTLIGAVLTCALAGPAAAAGMLVSDFERLDADPQHHDMVIAYLAGSVEGILIGAGAEAKAQTGRSGLLKLFCPDFEDHYKPEQTLDDVRAILKAHPEIPRQTTTMGAVVVKAVVERYRCQ